jgi:hypothetical protein
MEGYLLHLQQRDRFWLPTLNLYQWTGRNQKSSLALVQSKGNSLRCQWGFWPVLSMSSLEIPLNLLPPSITLFIGNPYVHFRRGEYHLRSLLSLDYSISLCLITVSNSDCLNICSYSYMSFTSVCLKSISYCSPTTLVI